MTMRWVQLAELAREATSPREADQETLEVRRDRHIRVVVLLH